MWQGLLPFYQPPLPLPALPSSDERYRIAAVPNSDLPHPLPARPTVRIYVPGWNLHVVRLAHGPAAWSARPLGATPVITHPSALEHPYWSRKELIHHRACTSTMYRGLYQYINFCGCAGYITTRAAVAD